jgi:beta-galactosidase
MGAAVTPVASLDKLPADGRVLVVGKDALDVAESTSSRLAAWASAGRTVIVLEQQNPLQYQALPAAMEPTNDTGRIAYADDPNHPALRGLTDRDFFTWGPEQVVFDRAYQKPTAGARSLIQCGNRLADTALAEVPVGKGLLLLSQLRVGETVGSNAVARRLLANLVSYGASYKPRVRPVVVAAQADPQFANAVKGTGVTSAPAADPVAAIRDARPKIAVVAASPANLKALAANKPLVDKFTAAGGFLVLSGLTPDGLADYNKLVGVGHLIRPFRRERVIFPAKRHPLTAGLTAGDIVMQSGKRINDFTSDVYLASDVFSYCVDYDEVAPFAKLPDSKYFGYDKPENDHDPYNAVNGFFSADGWQYILSLWAGNPEGPKPVPFSFAKPQTITRMEWAGNAFYWPTRKVELTFDGKAPVSFTTEPNNEPQTFAVKAPGPASTVTLAIKDWEKRTPNAIVGIDNVRLFAKRSPEFYRTVHPLLNVGALMEYDRGAGGIVLCNIQFKDSEEVPENGAKKRRILATLLRNLDAPFGGERTILAGTPLTYAPVDLAGKANQYRNEQGWFGDKQFTFAALPSGPQTFANVRYQVYDFKTSPVPTAVMLGGPGVPGGLPDAVTGIAVNKKADALFFLQAARIDRRRDDRERREGRKYELARYVVHYADGKTENVPVYAEIDVDDYKQQGTPKAIPGAQIAWTAPYASTGYVAVAYSKQWNNPRPQVPIASIDLVSGENRDRGVPVLLAVTAATQPQAIPAKPSKEAKR